MRKRPSLFSIQFENIATERWPNSDLHRILELRPNKQTKKLTSVKSTSIELRAYNQKQKL